MTNDVMNIREENYMNVEKPIASSMKESGWQ